jgi:hypothetical protein
MPELNSEAVDFRAASEPLCANADAPTGIFDGEITGGLIETARERAPQS